MQHIQSGLPSGLLSERQDSVRCGRWLSAARFGAGRRALLVVALGAFASSMQAAPPLDAAAARAQESATAPGVGKLQARLDALQHITVTEQRGPATDVPAASPTVQAVLDDAAQDELSASADAADMPD